jgi:ABC-type spermidine/putrescine transport system permease subunit II
MDSLRSSLTVALLTILISLPLGLLAAIAFTRFHLKWQGALSMAIMLPLFVPPVILGLGSLAFHRAIGIWGTHLSVAAAHSLWAIPLVFVVMKATLGGVDRSLEEAAAGLGASPIRVFFEVTLPLVATGVFVGVLFAFIISINEFIMALFLGTADVKTLPVAIWPKIRYLLTPIVAAASSIIILITLAILVVCARLINIRRILEYR